ncbi:MAG: SRPBCC family protein [Pseudomonadota bacterium]
MTVFRLKSVASLERIVPHFVGGCFALAYAWHISQTQYVKTGLQFIAPLFIIMVVHLAWLLIRRENKAGFSILVYLRCAKTCAGIVLFVGVASLLAPMPAESNVGVFGQIGDALSGIFAVIVCLFILAIVVSLPALAVYAVFKVLVLVWALLRPGQSDGKDTRLWDAGSLVAGAVLICASSLEGVPNAYTFATNGKATATHYVSVSPEKVWAAMQTATAPSFPLPEILHIFPQPVDVVIDEGTGLHAKRVVKIKGRPGEGLLSMQVVESTDRRAVFKVLSDTSPTGRWIAHRYLIYDLSPEAGGTRLSVTLEYDRKLAPSWFFDPAMKVAGYLAMDVLARDTKIRAERL